MRALAAIGALVLTGCNLIFDLQDAAERTGGSGGGPQGASGEGAAGGGGAGSGANGGGEPEGGQGGGACPPEVPAGAGAELLPNGSFEGSTSPWVASGLEPALITNESDCGCQAAEITTPASYSELRGPFGAVAAGNARVRARARAANGVSLELQLRVDDIMIEPPYPFAADASDGETDGWRTAEGDWDLPAGEQGLFVVVVDGTSSPAGSPVVLDCVSLTQE